MNWTYYLIQVNLYLILFYGFYFFLLRNETFFQLNRIYLVGSSLLSLCIPVFYFEWINSLFITEKLEQSWPAYLTVAEGFAVPISSESYALGDFISLIYLLGVIAFSLRFMYRLLKVQILLKSQNQQEAFSFFNNIKVDPTLPQRNIIIAHEKIHAKQLHSADILFFEIVSIINWFNPVSYLYKIAIKQIHEFIADEAAIQSETSKREYVLLLFSKSFGIKPYKLTNTFFNQSLLKRRIQMLQKQKSKKTAILKYGLSVPLFLMALILSSANINDSKTLQKIASRVETKQPLKDLLIPDINFVINEPKLQNKSSFLNSENKVEQAISKTSVSAKLSDTATKIIRSSENIVEAPISKELYVTAFSNNDTSSIYTKVDVLPQFKGGMKPFYNFLGSNMKYPAIARENNIQGRVILNFIVEKDGSLNEIKILRGISKELDEEALRVIKLSPNWEPGLQAGRPVRVSYTIPIMFSLNNDSSKSQYILLDGKPITETEMKKLKPEEIEKIEVLKDKNATDKYGEKGKNGVVIITLKSKK